VDRLDALPMTWDRRHEWKDWATGAQRRELREWLSGLDYPLGVFALRDSFGREILEACADLGLRVPDKVAVLGMNNDRIQCELAVPTLSSIEPPYQLVGYRASASLAALMAGRPLPSFDPLPPPQLVVRQSTDAVATDDPDVVAAMRYMRENLGQPIGTGRIARAMGISQRSLERHFKRALDTTPGRELKRLRLEMARQMLADPDQSVESVAEACGLVSAQYLARWLKRETGHAPAEFRRRNNITDADA
jgi:LacI family transcriptional regulator